MLAPIQAARELEHELYRAQMFAAESAIRLDELAVARSWLDATAADLRGFEWKLRDAELDQSLVKVPVGDATALAASPTDAQLALGFANGAVELRGFDGALVAELGRHAEAVTYVRYSPDGSRAVTASFDRTVKVWDLAAKKLALEFRGHGSPVGGAEFSPDGKLVASCSYERTPERGVVGTLHLWSASDGAVVRTLEGGRKPLVGLAFSPDGERVAAGSWDFCVFVWNVAGGEPLKCAMPDEGPEADIYNAVDDVVWSADGRHVIGASRDRTARVWDAKSGELVTTLRGHTDAVGKLALAPGGDLLASASSDGTLALWNTADGSRAATLRGHSDDVVACAFSANGTRLVSVGSDGALCEWDARPAAYDAPRFATTSAAYVAQLSPNDRQIAVASYDGRIAICDAATLELSHAWQAHPDGKSCHALAWTPDGKRLISGSWEPVVRVWNAADGAELARFEQPAGTQCLAVSPDGLRVATCAAREVLVWDLANSSRVTVFERHGTTVASVAFSPDSTRCVSVGRDGTARAWNAATGVEYFVIACASRDVADVLYTPDGAALVIATRDGALTLHRASDGALVRELARLRHAIDHVDVSPDGTRLAVASEFIALVDLDHGGVVGELRAHTDGAYDVDFDSRGVRLVSCSVDRSVLVHDARPLRAR